MPAPEPTSLPLRRRLLRILRDLRVSLMLAGLTLLPSAASAQPATIITAEPAGAAGRAPALADTHIIHVPGIAGPLRIDRHLAEGLLAGGAASEVEIFDWVGRRRGFKALFGVDENHRQARRLALHILQLRQIHPDRRLVITAHSGGTAIAAWALEMLPALIEEQKGKQGGEADDSLPMVDGVILMAAGLSPEYDLSPMLRQVRGRVFHLSSKADNLILGAGTLVLGTLDRKFAIAAGKTGFYLPPGVEPAAYATFVEVPYDATWAELGHYGEHEGMMTTPFGASVISDLVRAALGESVPLPTTRPASPAPADAPTTAPATQPAQ